MRSVKRNLWVIGAVLVIGASALAMLNTGQVGSGGNIYQDLQRFTEVMKYVSQYYVEEVDTEKLVTGAINGMLEKLDPHSVYIPKDQLADVTERFEGHFFGIGIEFIIHNKILTIVSPIAGSPSERLGLRPGDQIVEIEGVSTYGITEDEVMKKLKGPQGTNVEVTIRRAGADEPFKVRITRDKISVYSVLASFMLNEQTGYIHLNRFAKTTADELEAALRSLEAQGMKQLVFDLRNNSGGYLEQAVAVSDKFIDGNKKIVYTRGRIPQANEDFYSTSEGTHPRFPLIVLLNHGSASASEIVAGAVQDLDRGLIVGETSFGKGLVQNQIPLKDGSALRVTIAHYYTPSGRVIQRPYDKGLRSYIEEGWDDDDPNAAEDTTAERPVFHTSNGRSVYGGGGITPDVIVKSEGVITKMSAELLGRRIFFEYGAEFATAHKYLTADFDGYLKNFVVTDAMLADFRKLMAKQNVKFNQASWDKDINIIKLRIKSEIARNLWDNSKYYQVEVHNNNQVQEALRLFPEASRIAQLGTSSSGVPRRN
jgi:carboxyl-terminal processing protease